MAALMAMRWRCVRDVPEEIGAALLPGAHDGWPHHPLSYAEVPVTTTLHTAALMHPALHAQLPVSDAAVIHLFSLCWDSACFGAFLAASTVEGMLCAQSPDSSGRLRSCPRGKQTNRCCL